MGWTDGGRGSDAAHVGVSAMQSEKGRWRCWGNVEKVYKADCPVTGFKAGQVINTPFEGNLLMNGGVSVLFERSKVNKPSTSSTGAALQAYSTGNSRLGVGNSTATAAVTQNDLQGASKKYNAMASGYPQHTDGTSSSGARIMTWRATFTTAQANFAWQEWGLFNSTGASRRMLNRKVQSLGTKTSAASWQLTVTVAIS